MTIESARDLMHLDWLYLRDAGWTTGQIGKRYGVPSSHVRTVQNRITKDYEASEMKVAA
jgi:hypothetical protein